MPHLYAHHYVIAGKGQRRGRLSGCDRTIAEFDRYRRPGVRIESFNWDSDWRDEAAFIARHAPPDVDPIVCIYPYSWGFGWGAIQLAQELHRLHIPVYGMRVCDGVYRHSYPWGNWRALWKSSVVQLPPNVNAANVQLFVQRNTLLRGHRVVDAEGNEIVPSEVKRVEVQWGEWHLSEPAAHGNLDEARCWRNACCELAAEVDWMLDVRDRLFAGEAIHLL